MSTGFTKIIVIGTATRDAELQYVGEKGTAMLKVSLAINTSYKANDGSYKKEVCYIEFTLWSNQAERHSGQIIKGADVLVIGELIQDRWEDKETGAKRSKHKIKPGYDHDSVKVLRGGNDEEPEPQPFDPGVEPTEF